MRKRIWTADQRARKNANSIKVLRHRRLKWFSENGPCRHCGSLEKLELDHIIPETKIHHSVWSWKEDRRNEELKKCQVLCKSCHREKTNSENRKRFTGIPKLHLRTVKNEDLLKVKTLVDSGVSERAACKIIGISRSSYSVIKIRKTRPELGL